ncbi:DUF3995 domain-containing protein [Streptacidiphilus pinicola]|uniref:DUF3995 domain-containing protein n=1 Tax=Streptacidiphilus pinicola TaxID=2219663 RepID=UPI00140390B4|nr:DUF3995 domain-containing protein [Streptacidiphilus pinicola]
MVFAGFHIYWALGGTFGFGDASTTVPPVHSATQWAYTVLVTGLFVVGAALPFALYRSWGRALPRWLLHGCAWIGGALLGLRGFSGLLDTALRRTGLMKNGLTGLTYQQILGVAHPDAYTLWSSSAIDLYFATGGVLYCLLALAHQRARPPTP